MTLHTLDQAHVQYLTTMSVGRLATVAPNGAPQNKPVGFRFNAELGTIDISGIEMERSAKYRNVAAHPQVAFVVDDVPGGDGVEGVRFAEIRGTAERVRLDPPPVSHVSDWIIRIHPRRVVSWNVDPAHPGLRTHDLATEDEPPRADPPRPVLGGDGVAGRRAVQAVKRQVAELQEGLDEGDAVLYNRHFAHDVLWGSPYGATVDGYDQLHAIHRRLHAQARGGAGGARGARGAHSRYEIVRVLAPTPDVALAQVRRTALGSDGEPLASVGDERRLSEISDGEPLPSVGDEPRLSEMALYVLVRHDRDWWLAAGQNTIVRADRGAVSQD